MKKPIEHGTPRGYRAELRRDGQTCLACRAAHAAANQERAVGNPRRRPSTGRPVGRPVGSCSRRDAVMGEWEYWREQVGFEEFAVMVGMTPTAWARMFQRARKADDPRAVRRHESGRRAA